MNDYPVFTDQPSCAETDPEMWFPIDERSKKYLEPQLLKEICSRCNVKAQCLDYALKHAVDGYWAGTTAVGRLRIRKNLNIKAIPLVGING